MIVGDVVGLEYAGCDVAQDEVGRAGAAHRGNARELPVQADGPEEGRAGELVVGNVVDLQSASVDVAQEEIGFAGNAAEIADARELPIEADRADEGGVGNLIVGDVLSIARRTRGGARSLLWRHNPACVVAWRMTPT